MRIKVPKIRIRIPKQKKTKITLKDVKEKWMKILDSAGIKRIDHPLTWNHEHCKYWRKNCFSVQKVLEKEAKKMEKEIKSLQEESDS